MQQQQQQFQIQQQLAQQQQQQLVAQQQQQQQQMMNSNQLSLYKPVVSQPPQPQIVQFQVPQQQVISQPPQDDINQQRQQTIIVKLDTINEKLEQIKSIQQQSSAVPTVVNMETGILLSNLQRIIKENEQYKKDLYEKSVKIEDLNGRITELLSRNQSFVEKSHMLLEQKNSSYSETTEKNVLRILELEQDKMKLTQELTNLTSKISDLQLQVNKQNMAEYEIKQRFSEISKSYDTEKNEIERLRLDNLEQKSKMEALMDEFKKERQHKKQLELELGRVKEERHEFKEEINNFEKLLNEKRAKYEADKKQYENDMEETKQQFTSEIAELKEKLTKYRNNTNELNKEQTKQLEADLTNEWKIKLEKALKQQEQKYERNTKELNEERNSLEKQLNNINEQFKIQREKFNQVEIENEELKERIDELNIIEEKFKRLQSQALLMKERYETRIKELMDAEPDQDVLNAYVKKCMNSIYQKLKSQVSLKYSYSGEGVLAAMLKLIKFVTIQIMKPPREDGGEDNEDEEIADYFSEYIVDADEKLDDQRIEYESKINKLKEEFDTRQQLITLQHEAQLRSMESKTENLKFELKEEVRKRETIEMMNLQVIQRSTLEVETNRDPIVVEKSQIEDENVRKETIVAVKTQEVEDDEVEIKKEIVVVDDENEVNIAATELKIQDKEEEEEEDEDEEQKSVEEEVETEANKVESFVELSEETPKKDEEKEVEKFDENYSSIYDVPDDDDFKIEIKEEKEVSIEDDTKKVNVESDDEKIDMFDPPPIHVEEKKQKKKSLFDDDDDDDDLFSYSISTPNKKEETKQPVVEPKITINPNNVR